MNLPEIGTMTQSVMVFHDGKGSPLMLSVKSEGERKLPVLDEVVNAYPFFNNLVDTSPRQTIIVKTFEEIDSRPWLGPLSTGDSRISLTGGHVSEVIDVQAEFVRRTYEYVVSWTTMPQEKEVRSRIFARTDIDPPPGVLIGFVTGIRRQSPFAPSVVHLELGRIPEDWVVWNRPDQQSEEWDISEGSLPKWLGAEWQNRDGRRRLRLWLTDAFEGRQQEHYQLPLVNADNEMELIEVLAYSSN